MLKELDEIIVVDKIIFKNKTIEKGTRGVVLDVDKSKDGVTYYTVELYDTNFDTPIFDFVEDQIKLVD